MLELQFGCKTAIITFITEGSVSYCALYSSGIFYAVYW